MSDPTQTEATPNQPLEGEVFVLWSVEGTIACVSGDGPEPLRVPLDASVDPLETIEEVVRTEFGDPYFVHSTSWRHVGHAVVLTFVAVVEAERVGDRTFCVVLPTDLPRPNGTAEIGTAHVLEHAMRHLAWLAAADPQTRIRLPQGWPEALDGYEAEPFRSFR